MPKEGVNLAFKSGSGKFILLTVGLMASTLLVIISCGGTSTPANSEQVVLPSTQPLAPAATHTVSPPPEDGIVIVESYPAAPGLPGELRSTSMQYASNQQLGIWVTGHGEVAAPPDLVTLSIGVEARAATVRTARVQAAKSMDQMLQAIEALDIHDPDIQTQFFDISPEYEWNDRDRRQELVGYIVNNQVEVKIRDLDNVGLVIDSVAEAGGDLVRINSIRFSIEGTKALESQARENAVGDLMAKAQHFANLTNVSLGKLVFISETGGFVPMGQTFNDRAFAEGAFATAPSTSIISGELMVSMRVQGVFAIE